MSLNTSAKVQQHCQEMSSLPVPKTSPLDSVVRHGRSVPRNKNHSAKGCKIVKSSLVDFWFDRNLRNAQNLRGSPDKEAS